MNNRENIAKIESSLDLLHSLLLKEGSSQRFRHFFALYSIVLVVILDTVYNLEYWLKSESKYEKVLICQSLAVIVVTFLEESKGCFGPDYQSEMNQNYLLDAAKNIGNHNSQLKRFRTQNMDYFKSIRNKTMSHRGNGILIALAETNQISNEQFMGKMTEFVGILKLFFDELGQTAKSIVAVINQPK